MMVEPFFDIANESDKGFKGVDCYSKFGEIAITEVEAITMKYAGLPPRMALLMGFANAQAITAGLEKAGKNLTVDNFVKALESLKKYDMKGTLPPLTLTPDRHYAVSQNRVFEVDLPNQTWKEISPAKSPKVAR